MVLDNYLLGEYTEKEALYRYEVYINDYDVVLIDTDNYITGKSEPEPTYKMPHTCFLLAVHAGYFVKVY